MFEILGQTTQPVITGLDVVNSVDQFYSHARAGLINLAGWIGAIGVVLIGGNYIWQRVSASRYRRELKRVRGKLGEQEKTLDDLLRRSQEGVRQVYHHSAMHWLEMASSELDAGAWMFTLKHWCYALDSALLAEWPAGSKHWEGVLEWASRARWSPLEQTAVGVMSEGRVPIRETMERLRSAPPGKPYDELREFLSRFEAGSKPPAEGGPSVAKAE